MSLTTSATSALPSAPDAHELDLTPREKVFTMVGTLLALFLAALDQTIVGTAGPAIQRDLHVAPSIYPWITTAYLVASTVMVPIYGKLSDLFGRKRILLLGIALFLVGSAACGFSQTTLQLVAARTLQGAGSASLFTSALSVIADIFPPAERGRWQGLFGGCFALASVVGPLVGGFLTDRLSWHWVFFVNLPIGAVAVAFIVSRMPALRRRHEKKPKIDWAGALTLVLFVVPLLLGLSFVRGAATMSTALFVVSALGLFSFLAVEARASEPLLDLRLFANRTFAIGNLVTFIIGATFLGAIVFLPLYLVNVVGVSATDAGLTMIPLTFGIVSGSILAGQLVARTGKYKWLMVSGNAILLVAFTVLAFTLRPDSSQREVTLKMVLLGIGLGPTMPLCTLAVQNSVEPRHIGIATASVAFFRQIGSTIGVTVLGAVFAVTLMSRGAELQRPTELAAIPAPIAQAELSESDAPRGGVQLQVNRKGWGASIDRTLSDPTARAAAHASLERWDQSMKRVLTDAMSAIYRVGLAVALLGALLTLALPSITLRRTQAPAPAE